jgi:Sds3-like
MQPTISSSDYVGSQHQNQQYQSQEMQPMHSAAHAGSYGIDAQNPQHQAPSHAPPQSTPPLAAVYPTTAGPVTGQMMPTQHNNPTPTTGHFSVGIPPAPVGTPQGLPVPHIVNPVQSDPATMKDQTIPPESSSSQSSIVSNRPNAAVGSAAGVVPSSDITHQSNYSDDADIDSDNDEVSDELRKLDEDFQKNLERTRKVFVNRMDNLQRSQVEREAQHLKTLEKHEKERAEFEKRLAQEAEQQNRRIEQLQREWDKRRETVAMNKRRPKDGSGPGAGGIATDVSADALTASASSSAATHLRTASSASSNFSVSPSLSLHKLPQEPGSGGDGGSTDR